MICAPVIWFTGCYKPLLKLHHEIEGQWLVYLWNLIALRRFRRENLRGRLDLHNIFNEIDFAAIGMSSMPAEIVFSNPKKVYCCTITVNFR